MTTYYAVLEGDRLVSTGTVLADPLPLGMIAVPLFDVDVANMQAGGLWNGAGFDPPLADPAPAEE